MQPKVQLRRVLSAWDATLYIICSIIGSGIFISPKGVLLHTGSTGMALVMWFVTGIINVTLAFCYAELSLTFPKAGSDYTYITEGFGETLSFLYIWVNFVFQDGCSRAVVALTFSTYFCQMFFPPSCPPSETLKRLVATLSLSLLTLLQAYSSKIAVKTADFFTIAKLIGLGVIIVSGIVHALTDDNTDYSNILSGSSTDPGSYALAFYVATFAYGGVSDCMNVVEEIRQPLKRNIVLSIVMSQTTVIIVYLLTNFAYISVLNASEILSTDAVAMTFSQKLFGHSLFWLMPFFVACSTFGTMNNQIMNSSRLILAATRLRHMPRPLGLLNAQRLTPMPIFIINLLISVLLLSTSQIYSLIHYTSYTGTLGMTMAVSALVYLRVKRPKLERPFAIPLFLPIAFLFILIVLLIFPIYQNPLSTGICLGFIASGIPVYYLMVFPKRKPKSLFTFEKKATHLVQKLLLALPEDKIENTEVRKRKLGRVNAGYQSDLSNELSQE